MQCGKLKNTKSYHQLSKFMKHGIKLRFLEGTKLSVLFSDGVTKIYDVMVLAKKYPQIKALKNRKLFLSGYLLGTSGIYWNDDLDLDIESVYEFGETGDTTIDDLAYVLGFHIKEFRQKNDITQEDLAKITKIDQGDLSRIEKGTANASLKTIARVLKGMNANISIKIS